MRSLVLICFLLLAACAPSAPSTEAIQTAIAQTQAAASPTYTPLPTATHIPTPTASPEASSTPEITTAWPTTTDEGNQIIQQILDALSDAGVQIVDPITYTDATDPNGVLGRPHGYIAKAAWIDPSIATGAEPSVDNGGSIEVFLTQEDLQVRYDYVDAISATPLFAEYHYQNAPAFLRLSKAYLPSKAQEIADIFAALKFENAIP